MANKEKQIRHKKALLALGPLPTKPEEVTDLDWRATTDNAKRAWVKALKEEVDPLSCLERLFIPRNACWIMNDKFIHGRVIMEKQEALYCKSVLLSRNAHDRGVENGGDERTAHIVIGE